MFNPNRGAPATLGGSFGVRNFRADDPVFNQRPQPRSGYNPTQQIPFRGVPQMPQSIPYTQPQPRPQQPIPYMGAPQTGNALSLGHMPQSGFGGQSYGGFGNALSGQGSSSYGRMFR